MNPLVVLWFGMVIEYFAFSGRWPALIDFVKNIGHYTGSAGTGTTPPGRKPDEKQNNDSTTIEA